GDAARDETAASPGPSRKGRTLSSRATPDRRARWSPAPSQAPRPEERVQAGEDPPGVLFEDPLFLRRRYGPRVDVALGVIEVVAGARVDGAHGAHHLRPREKVAAVADAHPRRAAGLEL